MIELFFYLSLCAYHKPIDMSIDKNQFRHLIQKTLHKMDMHSQDAVELLMGTAAQETKLGAYIYQLGGGPGMGFFQMEPSTEKSLWENIIRRHPEIAEKLNTVCGVYGPGTDALETNISYMIAMARIRYLPAKPALPKHTDIQGLAEYYKTYYNTRKGKATPEMFVANYERYCLP